MVHGSGGDKHEGQNRSQDQKSHLDGPQPVGSTGGEETLESPVGARSAPPIAEPLASAPLYEKPGTVVGRYKLLRQIGEGGFGVVYLAEQEQPLRRMVALKIIKLGMDTRQVIARFEAERQALAMMDHPNIARALDAGATETGRPFFVMELVEGIPITEYCNKYGMSPVERLKLFLSVCGAVQHAHQKGVIHRDIKPGNVLVTHVDDRPVPKVIDFGIAKATQHRLTEHTLFTEFGQFIGTPAYMSPEQADPFGLDIDTRSDIYSLGVLLYELLTGATPFDGRTLRRASLEEVKRIIREVDPPRPSTRISGSGAELDTVARERSIEPARLRTVLRGDLDWIVMKSMEKDRARRYETANGLAMDIQRYLANEPVSAGPPTAAYRFHKFVRRNRAAVLVGAAVTAILVFGVIGTSAGMVWAIREKNRADLAAGAEIDARREAQEQARVARAVNDFLTEDLLSAIDPTRNENREITMRQVVDEAALRIGTRFRDQPLVAASIERTLGQVYTRLGVHASAELHLRRAHELLRAARGERDRETLSLRGELDRQRYYAGQYEQGIHDMESSLAVMRDTLGEDDSVTLLTLAQLALLHGERNKPEKAEPMYLRAIEGLDRALGSRHRDTMSVRNNLAMLYADLRQFDKAEELLNQVGDVMKAEYGEEDPDTLEVQTNFIHLYNEQERFSEALDLGLGILPICRRVLGNEHIITLNVMNNLAIAYVQTGRLDLAEPLYREDFEISRRVLGAEHPGTLTSMTNLGRLLMRTERLDESIQLLSECDALNRKVLPPGHIGIGITLEGLGSSLFRLGRFEEAIPALLESYEVLAPIFGPGHSGTRKTIEQLAAAFESIGNSQSAAEWKAKLPSAPEE